MKIRCSWPKTARSLCSRWRRQICAVSTRCNAERDEVLAFQLALGRTNELNLAQVTLAIAKQRLDSARTLNINYWAYRGDIQKGLINLASEEIGDAILRRCS